MATFKQIIETIDKAVKKFNKNIPAAQRGIYEALQEELRKLDLNGDQIKPTVKNLSIIARIKAKINKVILTDEYVDQVKEFVRTFNEIAKLQNDYWRSIERTFKPKPLLKAIRQQAITDTTNNLLESGLDANVAEPIRSILQSNITTGGSMKELEAQLRESLLNTETSGTLDRYAKTITTTSINSYSAQYTQIVSNDLGFTWYRYANTLIKTSREFCKAMRRPENQYFHVSMIPSLLKAEGLFFKEDGEEVPVRINPKTDLPYGFLQGTNEATFLVNRAGWNCGHQAQPISEGLVPKEIRDKIMQRPDYQRWAELNKKPA
jgi:hypothetical protein